MLGSRLGVRARPFDLVVAVLVIVGAELVFPGSEGAICVPLRKKALGFAELMEFARAEVDSCSLCRRLSRLFVT